MFIANSCNEVLRAIERDEVSPEKQPKQKQTEAQANATSQPESAAQQLPSEQPVKTKTASFGNFF